MLAHGQAMVPQDPPLLEVTTQIRPPVREIMTVTPVEVTEPITGTVVYVLPNLMFATCHFLTDLHKV